MNDNTRPVPGSTRSCRNPLSRPASPAKPFQDFAKSTYKTQTKCRQNHKYDFFNDSASTTYNFNPLTCLNFTGTPSRFDGDSQSLGTESRHARLGKPVECSPFSPGEKVRMRDRLVTICSQPHGDSKLYYTVQNETKWDDFESVPGSITSYQRLATTLFHDVPFFGRSELLQEFVKFVSPNQTVIKPNKTEYFFGGVFLWGAIPAPPPPRVL
jgi:hypothetical protein